MNEYLHQLIEVVKHTVMITFFVMAMMLIIEFVNVQTKGRWKRLFNNNKWSQVLVGSLLGATPGCLGAYAVVSLYTHNIFRLGALVAAMIATFGDEAFILFSISPKTGLLLMAATFAIAIITGMIINLFSGKKTKLVNQERHFEIHEENVNCCETKWQQIFRQLRKLSFQRGILLFGLVLFLLGLISGEFGHNHGGEQFPVAEQVEHVGHNHDDHNCEDVHQHHDGHGNSFDWIQLTFIVVTGISILLITIVTEHFLQDHLWGHIIKKHFLKIFLWTFGTLLVIQVLLNFVEIDSWIKSNQIMILAVALLVGIIPVSGPHLAFVSLYFAGSIPFSILLASSVVQDGHGALPLFAESKRSFLLVKGINILVGLAVGLAGYLLNF